MISSRDLALVVKNPPTNAEDIRLGLIPRSGRSPGGGHSNPLQSSCLENPPGHRSLEGYSPWGHRVGHNSSDLAYSTGIRKLSNFTPLTNSLLKWKRKSLSHVQLFATPWLYSPWNSPSQNTGVGSLSLLQGIFPIQGSNPGLLHCRPILYQLSCKGSPRILEWVNCPFSRGSSWPRNRTGVPHIAGRFFTNWAIREAHSLLRGSSK